MISGINIYSGMVSHHRITHTHTHTHTQDNSIISSYVVPPTSPVLYMKLSYKEEPETK